MNLQQAEQNLRPPKYMTIDYIRTLPVPLRMIAEDKYHKYIKAKRKYHRQINDKERHKSYRVALRIIEQKIPIQKGMSLRFVINQNKDGEILESFYFEHFGRYKYSKQ